MSNNSKILKNSPNGKKNVSKMILLFIALDIIVLIISFILPYIFVSINQSESCLHHFEDFANNPWILGRALGFTTFIWFAFTVIIGANTKKIGKLFNSYQTAKNFHCLHALITSLIFVAHVVTLLNSDPWGPLIFRTEYNHLPFSLFVAKIWTGIIFAIVMIGTTIMFFYLRNVNRLKKFGYKRFIKIHHFMLLMTMILAVHIFLINTELMIILWG